MATYAPDESGAPKDADRQACPAAIWVDRLSRASRQDEIDFNRKNWSLHQHREHCFAARIG